MAKVNAGNIQGVINKLGEEVVPLRHSQVIDQVIENAVSFQVFKTPNNTKSFVYYQDRDTLIEYSSQVLFYDNLAVVGNGKKYGVIDNYGRSVVGFAYDWIDDFRAGHTLARKDNGSYFVINGVGKEVELPGSFKVVNGFCNLGIAAYSVLTSDSLTKYGFINTELKKITPPLFEDYGELDYQGRCLPVKKDGYWGAIAANGTIKVPFLYEEIVNGPDEYGNIMVKKSGYLGVVDTNNEPIIPFEYDADFNSFSRGKGLFTFTKNNQVHLFDERGNTILTFNKQGSYPKIFFSAVHDLVSVWWYGGVTIYNRTGKKVKEGFSN